MVVARSQAGKSYGVVLIPEGLIEQVHDMQALFAGGRGWAGDGWVHSGLGEELHAACALCCACPLWRAALQMEGCVTLHVICGFRWREEARCPAQALRWHGAPGP